MHNIFVLPRVLGVPVLLCVVWVFLGADSFDYLMDPAMGFVSGLSFC
jgi:hypothetical protein